MPLSRLELWTLLFLPGFTLVFLIAWRRSRDKPRFSKIALWATLGGVIGAALAFCCLEGLFFSIMRDRLVDHFTTPLTVAQARQQNCPIPLPDNATNVQYAFASGGIVALEILVRFEAPVDTCQSHVQTVFDAYAKQNKRPLHPLPLTPLEATPRPEDGDMVGRASWFDVEKIRHGLTAGGNEMQFWVDEERGVFYCKITD